MKICVNCGAVLNDDRARCVDCAGFTFREISENDAAALNAVMDKAVRGYNDDPFKLTRLDKIFGVLNAVMILVVIAAAVLLRNEDITLVMFASAFMFALGVFAAFFPKRISWEIKIFFDSWHMNGIEKAEPTEFWVLAYKFSYILAFAAGLFFALVFLTAPDVQTAQDLLNQIFPNY